MRQALLFLGVGLLGGFAVSAWWSSPTRDVRSAAMLEGHEAERVGAPTRDLSRDVADLKLEVEALRRELERLSQVGSVATSAAPVGADEPIFGERGGDVGPGSELPVGDVTIAPRERRFRMRTAEGRIEALTEAGFALDRAQHIERRVEELRVEAMQARYDAARRGDAPGEQLTNANAALRAELGDADYERYLDAMGQSTRVNVSTVLASSAAERAGILAGDQIVAYAGERVFDVRDLNQALLRGEPGEPVIVDIVRDGQPFQLVLPRGPLGITGGFGRGLRGP